MIIILIALESKKGGTQVGWLVSDLPRLAPNGVAANCHLAGPL
jgi:hypothetical protein